MLSYAAILQSDHGCPRAVDFWLTGDTTICRPNGNGRWSRLLANICFRLHDQPVIIWPEPEVGTASNIRQEYLEAVRAADSGDYDRLIDLHRRFTQAE